MKQKTIEFLQNLPKKLAEQFNEGLALYAKTTKKNENIFSYLNRAGFSKDNLETLLYHLKKDMEITSKDLRTLQVVKDEQVVEPIKVTATNLNEVFPAAPVEVKQGIKLRDLYPFLSEDNVPDKLKILVADKLTAYDRWVSAHNELLKLVESPEGPAIPMDEDQIFELAKMAVENFEMDELIKKELDHYQETKEILGLHPIFTPEVKEKEAETFTPLELSKKINNAKSNISKTKTKIETEKNTKKLEKLHEKLVEFELELALLTSKLEAKS